jgi:hypothetical protein
VILPLLTTARKLYPPNAAGLASGYFRCLLSSRAERRVGYN